MDVTHIRNGQHCVRLRLAAFASSSLKMTYCGSLCEKAGLGFTVEALLGNYTIVRSALEAVVGCVTVLREPLHTSFAADVRG